MSELLQQPSSVNVTVRSKFSSEPQHKVTLTVIRTNSMPTNCLTPVIHSSIFWAVLKLFHMQKCFTLQPLTNDHTHKLLSANNKHIRHSHKTTKAQYFQLIQETTAYLYPKTRAVERLIFLIALIARLIILIAR